MKTIQINIQDKLAVITLDRGRANPVNLEMLVELIAAVKDIEANNEVGGLIITGKEGFFSAGIDLMEVYNYDEQQIKDFWTNFLLMQATLVAFKKPYVAAITGHSPAGGCIIAMGADYRIMADGPFIIGLNEIPVGIIVPDSVFQLYSFWIGKRKAYQYLLEGKLLNVNEAHTDGLVDVVADASEVLTLAEQKVRAYMKMNAATWSQSKLQLRKELLGHVQADISALLDKMLQQWWSKETRFILQKVIDKLTNPVKN
ncbi:enoyl-CoA hydratase/isomerase family protein [Mucilaginibacter jinjuensis]|uniref:Enoyl-CoA hydratase/isomerase family protein n=1 Tax=Mucilaginibacter jinjuensis TaxID=1176721 RepID=A0ABY7T1N9_9SPHI|nr:enoyl-CoA hydratase/isomerase family protein [Mucilaginibacter jinjuensis]WCT10365.1 enoyl-CoA hydratase/isomerase family protein [Mucilaginibacter jinjuensis]